MADDFNFFKWLGGIFTDALGRPEVKMMLGAPLVIVSVVYGIATRDWIGFGALSGFAVSMLITTAAGDAVIDKAQISQGGK